MNKNTIIGLVIVIIILISGASLFRAPKALPLYDISAFAQCLAKNNVTMYGAAWCPHCQAQKALFGESFKSVPYVECPDDPAKCLAKGIEGYPTWMLSDGTKLVGEQSFEVLAKASSCLLTKIN